MGTGSRISAWDEFKSRTAIHGFAEYDGMRNVFMRFLWILAAIAAGGFCIYQVFGLTKSFVGHQTITSIDASKNPPLPDIAVMFRHRSYLGNLDSNYIVRGAILAYDHIFNGTCPYFPASRKRSVPEFAVEGPDQVTSDDIKELNLEYKRVLPSPSQMLLQTRMYRGSDFETNGLEPISRLTTRGPMYVVPMENVTAAEADRVSFYVNYTGWAGFRFLVGTPAVWSHDASPSISLSSGRIYTINVLVSVYMRSKEYCGSEHTKVGLSCVSYSVVQEAVKTDGCAPYLGEFDYPPGVRLCSPYDREDCTRTHRRCEEECRSCQNCKHCYEAEGISWLSGEKENLYGDISEVHVNFLRGTKTYYISEAYSATAYVSQLGGSLGLAFGVSLLSIVHLLYSLFRMVGEAMTSWKISQADSAI